MLILLNEWRHASELVEANNILDVGQQESMLDLELKVEVMHAVVLQHQAWQQRDTPLSPSATIVTGNLHLLRSQEREGDLDPLRPSG